jgi:hypothetical protein
MIDIAVDDSATASNGDDSYTGYHSENGRLALREKRGCVGHAA